MIIYILNENNLIISFENCYKKTQYKDIFWWKKKKKKKKRFSKTYHFWEKEKGKNGGVSSFLRLVRAAAFGGQDAKSLKTKFDLCSCPTIYTVILSFDLHRHFFSISNLPNSLNHAVYNIRKKLHDRSSLELTNLARNFNQFFKYFQTTSHTIITSGLKDVSHVL